MIAKKWCLCIQNPIFNLILQTIAVTSYLSAENCIVASAMSNPRAACDPIAGFVRPSLGFHCIKIFTTFPYFDYLEFDIFDAGGLQCHFITSVTIVVGGRTLPIH